MTYFAMLPARGLQDSGFIGDHPEDIGVSGWEFAEPAPLAGRFEAQPYSLDARKPAEQRKLYSWVDNAMRLAIVSGEFGDLLRELVPEGIELLRIRILDRHGGEASDEYSILHPLIQADAIDRDASTFDLDPLDPESFESWESLVLLDDRLPEEPTLFTLKGVDKIIFVSEAAKQRIEGTSGITGVRFVPLEQFASWDR